MAITIKKGDTTAYFTIQGAQDDVPRPYICNTYDFQPLGDDVHFSIVSLFRKNQLVNRPLAGDIYDTPIANQPYTNIINGDTDIAFASFSDLQDYVQANFFRNAGGGTGGTNIYNSDGSLTDSRIVTLGDKSLEFDATDGLTSTSITQSSGIVDISAIEEATGNNADVNIVATSEGNTGFALNNQEGESGNSRSISSAIGPGTPQGIIVSDTIDNVGFIGGNLFPLSGDPNQYVQAGNMSEGGSSEPSGQVKSFTQDYGGVGDGSADDTTAVADGIAGATRIFDNGDFLVTDFDNGKGVPLEGDTRILKATSNLNQQINTYADRCQRIFGQEYLAQFYNKVIAGTPTNVILSGDSTTAGTGGTVAPDVLLANLTNKFHISGITYINRGHGGQATSTWLSTYITADLASTPDVYILRWGINDSALISPEDFLTNLDTGLATIRSNSDFTVDKLTIILQSQNTTLDDDQGHEGQIFNEAVNNGLRGLARKHQCCFMDIYGQYQDSIGAAGVFLDPDGLHPKDVLYNMMMTSTINILLPEFLRGGDVTDRGTSGIQSSAANSAYKLGVNYDYVQVPDGFPAKGIMISNKMLNGDGDLIIGQLLHPFNNSGHYSRQAVNDTFSPWVAHNVNRGSLGGSTDAPATYPVGMTSQFVNSDFPIAGFLVTNRSDVAGGMSVQTLTSYDSGPSMYVRVSYLTGWQTWKQVTLI